MVGGVFHYLIIRLALALLAICFLSAGLVYLTENSAEGIFGVFEPSCLLPHYRYQELKEKLHSKSFKVEASSALILLHTLPNDPADFQNALEFIDSSRRYLSCGGSEFQQCSNVTYMILTNLEPSSSIVIEAEKNSSNQYIRIARVPAKATKFQAYLEALEFFKDFDFILAADPETRFTAPISLSKLSADLTAVLHPDYLTALRISLPYERQQAKSMAYVPLFTGSACRYYTAAVWGGRPAHFGQAVEMLTTLAEVDRIEFGRNFTARRGDESYLNRYFARHLSPTRVLSPSLFVLPVHN